MDRQDLLIDILLDSTVSVSERDDAAIDLSAFATEKTIKALLLVATDLNEDDLVSGSSGESLGLIWIKMKQLNLDDFNSLSSNAYREAYEVIKQNRPDWIEKYNLL